MDHLARMQTLFTFCKNDMVSSDFKTLSHEHPMWSSLRKVAPQIPLPLTYMWHYYIFSGLDPRHFILLRSREQKKRKDRVAVSPTYLLTIGYRIASYREGDILLIAICCSVSNTKQFKYTTFAVVFANICRAMAISSNICTLAGPSYLWVISDVVLVVIAQNRAVFIWVSKSNWFCTFYATRLA